MPLARLAVLVSGSGSNLQALIEQIHRPGKGQICLVLSDKPKAYGLVRARQAGIPNEAFDAKDYIDRQAFNQALLARVQSASVDFIVLAGYLKILTPDWIRVYPKRIINIHPSLIPKHCGKGFYGLKVHQSVLESGDKQTGVTIHYVDEGADTGPILASQTVSVLPNDTPESLQKRVLEIEHQLLPQVVEQLCWQYNHQERAEDI